MTSLFPKPLIKNHWFFHMDKPEERRINAQKINKKRIFKHWQWLNYEYQICTPKYLCIVEGGLHIWRFLWIAYPHVYHLNSKENVPIVFFLFCFRAIKVLEQNSAICKQTPTERNLLLFFKPHLYPQAKSVEGRPNKVSNVRKSLQSSRKFDRLGRARHTLFYTQYFLIRSKIKSQ